MKSPTPATADGNVPNCTGSPRWNQSQRSELNALQSGQWWPFQKADAQVLAWLHKQSKKPNPLTDAPEALL